MFLQGLFTKGGLWWVPKGEHKIFLCLFCIVLEIYLFIRIITICYLAFCLVLCIKANASCFELQTNIVTRRF